MNYEQHAEHCADIARKAHKGQTRRGGGPYFIHPFRVAAQFRESPFLRCVAYLHDVLEDTTLTADDLHMQGMCPMVVEAVEILTKTKGLSYEAYIEGVRCSAACRAVKVADMLDNLTDCPTDRQKAKYKAAIIAMVM